MGEGNGNGKAPVLGCGMSVFQKNYSWRKGSLLVYDPTFYITWNIPHYRMTGVQVRHKTKYIY